MLGTLSNRLRPLALLAGALTACGGGAGDTARDAATRDQRATPGDATTSADAADAATEASAADVGAAGAIERFAGIWEKDRTGDALVLSNDCGDFWRIDFDHRHSLVEPTSATTLRMRHCKAPSCKETDSVTTTLTVTGDEARHDERADLDALVGCTIETESSTRMLLEAAGRGRLRWRAALRYVGDACGPLKAKETVGDRCEAIAEARITRLP